MLLLSSGIIITKQSHRQSLGYPIRHQRFTTNGPLGPCVSLSFTVMKIWPLKCWTHGRTHWRLDDFMPLHWTQLIGGVVGGVA